MNLTKTQADNMIDCIGIDKTMDELSLLYDRMPKFLLEDANKWGTNDFVWQCQFKEWYNEKGYKVSATSSVKQSFLSRVFNIFKRS